MAITEYSPAKVLLPSNVNKSQYQFSLVLLNRSIEPISLFERLWSKSDHKVAADGAANWLYDDLRKQYTADGPTREDDDEADQRVKAFLPDAIVGDLDSVRPEIRDFYNHQHVPIIQDKDQYSTDLAKSVRHVYKLTRSPTTLGDAAQDIVLFGSLGGRIDQGLGVLHELYRESRRWCPYQGPLAGAGEEWAKDSVASPGEIWIGRRRFWLVTEAGLAMCLPPGKSRLVDLKMETSSVRVFAKEVGFMPVFGYVTISTKGLEWDVDGWTMEMGGRVSSSNHIREDIVEVEVSGWCLITFSLSAEFSQLKQDPSSRA